MAPKARFCHNCGWDNRLPGAAQRGAAARRAYERWIMGTILGLGLALVLYLLMVPKSGAEALIAPGNPAPEFTLPTLDGETISLSDLRGQAVVLNFWASWCPPCRAEMPDLERLYQTYRTDNLVVIGVNLQESPVTVRSFVEREGLGFPIVLDRDGSVTNLYRIIPLPTTFFIDPDGIITAKYEGRLSARDMDTLALGLLGR